MSCPITEAIKEMKEKLDRLEATKHLAIKIALKNKHGDIVGHALIDEEDRELTKINWWSTDGYGTNNDGLMHCLMMGEAPEGHIVDHFNGDRSDNRRANLRFATYSLNSSNKHYNDTRSESTGVRLHETGKWCAEFKHEYLGLYKSKEHAVWAYNVAAYKEFGKDANFNIIDKPLDWENTKGKVKKTCKSRGVTFKNGQYYAYIKRNKVKTFLGRFDTEEEASKVYEEAYEAYEAKKKAEHEAREMTRDSDGAYLMAGDTKVYVSESDWRDLSRFTWFMSLEYPTAAIGKKTLQMQLYLLGKKKGFVADHKNGDKTNNRRTNLHFATYGFNNHNKPTRSSTGFKGVQRKAMLKNGNYNYGAEIKYEKKKHRLGTYPTALLAACAYDNAAKHFYGHDANINGVGDQEGYTWNLRKLRMVKNA